MPGATLELLDNVPESLLRRLKQYSGRFSTQAVSAMQDRLPFFAELEASQRASLALVVQTAVANFVEWMTDPRSNVNYTARAFELMPQDLTRRIALRHSVDMLRVTMEFFEEVAPLMARSDEQLTALTVGILKYSRDLAFSAATAYADAAEARGSWDSRMEASVVDAVVRGDTGPELLSRAAALNWEQRGRNILLPDRWFSPRALVQAMEVHDYLTPDEAVRQAGVEPEDVSDVVISHAHWDHMGGIDLFPGRPFGLRRTCSLLHGRCVAGGRPQWRHRFGRCPATGSPEHRGAPRLVNGDDVEIIPGTARTSGPGTPIRGSTCGSMANCHSSWHPTTCIFIATDRAQGERHVQRRRPRGEYQSPGSHDSVGRIGGSRGGPAGHDALQFKKFPTEGRVAKIKLRSTRGLKSSARSAAHSGRVLGGSLRGVRKACALGR